MKQGKFAAFAWMAALLLSMAAPASAHPDPVTEAGALAYLVAAAITVAIFALIIWGRRIADLLRSALRRR